ncbi:hypothetical protein LB506_000136 [Fusarium annulatum]|nr:hypothetical protein LB506_000136 [Fusarium annulatum]
MDSEGEWHESGGPRTQNAMTIGIGQMGKEDFSQTICTYVSKASIHVTFNIGKAGTYLGT